MSNYSWTKLELLVLKWAVQKKIEIICYAHDNNPLAYVMESKLGTSQIQWLSELALFDFVIKYQTG